MTQKKHDIRAEVHTVTLTGTIQILIDLEDSRERVERAIEREARALERKLVRQMLKLRGVSTVDG